MKILKIDETTYNIPTSWNDITLQQQIEVEKLIDEHQDFKQIAILSGYLKIEVDVIKKLHFNTVRKLMSELQFMQQQLPVEPVHEFEHRGNKYYVIPSMLKGEFQDFISFEQVREQYKDKPFAGLPLMIAILCKRADESLDDYDIQERSKEFMDLPLPIANGLSTFFLTSAKLLNPDYNSVLQMQDQNIRQSTNSMLNTLKNSVGGGLLIRLLRVLLRTYILFLQKIWKRSYSGYTSEMKRTTLMQRFRRFFRKRLSGK